MHGHKTIIFAVILAVLGGIQTADLAVLVPERYIGLAMLAISAIVAALRILTDSPIGGYRDEDDEE